MAAVTSAAGVLTFVCVGVDRVDGGLVRVLEASEPSGAWVREGRGLVGLGVAAETAASGPDRFVKLAHWWEGLRWESSHQEGTLPGEDCPADAGITGLPAGVGPAGFTSLSYSSDSAAGSRLIVPELILAVTEEGAWLTGVVAGGPEAQDVRGRDLPWFEALLERHGLQLEDRVLTTSHDARGIPPAELREGTHPEAHYLQAVEAGVAAIAERRLEKLVLSRDAVVAAVEPIPAGPLLARLARDYSGCWTYRAGDVLGATPEMLVQVRGDEVSARVLAGTVDRSLGAETARKRLLEDPKQRSEHTLAVESLLEQLAPISEGLTAQSPPAVLELPNVYHLSTDVIGRLRSPGGISPLLVAERAHPTAAICGTPTATAAGIIGSLEGIDRGPFSGPVGWVDTRGNADMGIALRGGVLEDEGRQVRLYAGCGIVAGSEPESELAETWSKMRPMLDTLGVSDALST